MVQQEFRKGPWTEQEDVKLVSFVGLFGDRRWDFIAKVSGLKVAGDSNRWSRIARKLPGRTDNEIKNYWRTYMRKKAQETKGAATPSSISSCHSSLSSNNHAVGSHPSKESGEESFYDTGGPNMIDSTEIKIGEEQEGEQGYSMDDIWKDIALSEENIQHPVYARHIEEEVNFFCPHLPSPSWEYSSDSLWVMDEEESKSFLPTSDQFFSSFEQATREAFLTG